MSTCGVVSVRVSTCVKCDLRIAVTARGENSGDTHILVRPLSLASIRLPSGRTIRVCNGSAIAQDGEEFGLRILECL